MTGSKFSFYTPSFSVGTGDEAVDISAPTPTHSNTDVTKAKDIEDAAVDDAALDVVDEASDVSPLPSAEEVDSVEYEVEDRVEAPVFTSEFIKHVRSNVSDVTYETMVSTVATVGSATICSTDIEREMESALPTTPKATEASEELAPATPATPVDDTGSEAVSDQLEALIQDRARAIDSIRALLGQELEQDSGLIAEFTAKVDALECDIASKEECINDLNGKIDDIKAKNSEYAHELGKTINELVDSQAESIEQIVELEKELTDKKDTIEEMAVEFKKTEEALNKSNEENDSLTKQLEAFKSENGNLASAVEELDAKNNEYANELENMIASLNEASEQNATLESQVEDIANTSKRLEEAMTQIGAMKEDMAQEKESSAGTICQLEKTIAQLADQLETQKMAHEKQMSSITKTHEKEVDNLTKTWEDENATCVNQAATIIELQSEVAAAKKAADEKEDDLVESIELLEKKLKDELECSVKLSGKYQEECEKNETLVAEGEEMKAAAAKMVEEHEFEVETMKAEHELALTKMTQEHEAAIVRWEKLVETETEANIQTVEELSEEHNATVAKMAEEHQATVDGLEKRLEEETGANTKLAEEITSLTNSLEDEKKEVEGVKQSAAEAAEESASTIAMWEKSLEDELATSQKLNEKVKDMESRYHKQIEENNGMRSEMEEMRVAAAETLGEHKAATDSLESKMATMTKQNEGALAELAKEHESAIAKIMDTHEANATAMAQEYRATILQMNKQHDAAISGLESRRKTESRLAAELKQEVKSLSKRLEDAHSATAQIAKMHASIESKLETAQKAHKKEKSRMAKELEETAKMLQSNEDKLNKLQSELAMTHKQQNNEKAKLQERLDVAERHLSAANEQNDELGEQLKGMKVDVADAKGKQTDLLSRLNKLLECFDKKGDIYANANMDKNTLVDLVAATQTFNNKVQSEVFDLRRFVILSNFRDKTRWSCGA